MATLNLPITFKISDFELEATKKLRKLQQQKYYLLSCRNPNYLPTYRPTYNRAELGTVTEISTQPLDPVFSTQRRTHLQLKPFLFKVPVI